MMTGIRSCIHQRPARIARLHRHADLKIARVIPAPDSDAISASLGENPCNDGPGKPIVTTVPPMRRAARGNHQTEQGEIHLMRGDVCVKN